MNPLRSELVRNINALAAHAIHRGARDLDALLNDVIEDLPPRLAAELGRIEEESEDPEQADGYQLLKNECLLAATLQLDLELNGVKQKAS